MKCFCCIIPPHITDRMKESGDKEAKQTSDETRTVTNRLKARRLKATEATVAPAPVEKPCPENQFLYTANNTEVLPGEIIHHEKSRSFQLAAAAEAHLGALETKNLLWNSFRRRGLDGRGGPTASTVRYGRRYANAFWDGEQMAYGDGDGIYFNRFTIAVDIIGHELGHGVTQYTSNLDYWGKPGALNESFSDVLGSLVKQKRLRQKARNADWLIGEGLFTSRVNGKAIRSMSHPGSAYDDPVIGNDPQPAHMNQYYSGNEDSQGVHINSGIPNRAFYLVANALGGYAWDLAGRIWWDTFTKKLERYSGFQEAAYETIQSAKRIRGGGDEPSKIVESAWRTVGVNPVMVPA